MRTITLFIVIFYLLIAPSSFSQNREAGLNVNLGNIFRVSDAETRSISPENFTGEKGKAGMAKEGTGSGPSRELGQGWKVTRPLKYSQERLLQLRKFRRKG